MSGIAQDVRYALRAFRKSPGFTVIAVLTLALGIGANAAIFSIVNGVLLRPLAYPNSEQLMYLTTQFPAQGLMQFWVSPPEYMEFREINRSFSVVGAYATGEVNITAGDRPLRVRSASVDEHLLNALGIQPRHGRSFAEGETTVSGPAPTPGQPAPQPPRLVILSHELWQRAFGGRSMVGQTVEVNGLQREVIGIMPATADVMDNRTEIWLPLGLNPSNRQNRGNHYLYVLGRLRDGVTTQAAEVELNALMQNWGERTGAKGHLFSPLTNVGSTNVGSASPSGHILQMKPIAEEILGGVSRAIWVLQAAVAFVLLIACGNLANLLLARAETRHREFALRTALGAGQGRLLRQFITESLLLSIAGGAIGVLLARLSVQALIHAYPTTLPRTNAVTLDPLVLLFTFGVATATGLLFGLAPLIHTRTKGLVAALKEGGSRGATIGARHYVRQGLVMMEVALAVMLVIGAGLLVRTVQNLTKVDAGFDRSRLVTFSMTLPNVHYPQATTRAQLYQRLLANVRALPGVQSATAMSGLPPDRPLDANGTDIDNYTAPPEGPPEIVDYYQHVMADYFETMGIPIVQGRGFRQGDAVSPGLVAVVNETLANTFWKGRNPIGQRLRPRSANDTPWYTVIGVAKDVKQGGVDQETGTEFYRLVEETAGIPPPLANAPGTINVVLRTTAPAAALSTAIERAMRDVNPTIPIVRLRDMDTVFAEAISRPRLLAQVLGAFSGLGLLLAAVGTYGVLSYIVAERRCEIGIRMALGADRSKVLASVMNHGFLLASVGIIAGLAGAYGLTHVMETLLFGVRPTDAATVGVVVVVIAVVAAMASWLPAWRASRLDPRVALMDE